MPDLITQDTQPLILVVDDEAAQQLLLKDTLTQSGIRVIQAFNGSEALEMFNQHHPDLILMDINMPIMDGLKACTLIRQLERGKDIPIIMITGENNPQHIQQAFDMEATDFITKPVNWPTLSLRVRYLLKASEAFKALRLNEKRYQQIVTVSSDWVWEMDENLRFSYFSKGLGDVSSKASNFALGKIRQQLTSKTEQAKPHWKNHLADLKNKLEFRNFQYEISLPDNEKQIFQISGTPIFDTNGKFLGYRGIGRNVTKREKISQA